MVGFSIFLPVTFFSLLKDKRCASLLLCLIFAIFSIATYRRNLIWRDDITLWEDTVKRSPKKARPYNNLGFAYGQQGFHDKAVEVCQKAIELDPTYEEAYINLGAAYGQMRDYATAIRYYQEVLKLDPTSAEAHKNLGAAYGMKGDERGLLEEIATLRRLNRPDLADQLQKDFQ